jgi:hypothetical protein
LIEAAREQTALRRQFHAGHHVLANRQTDSGGCAAKPTGGVRRRRFFRHCLRN